MKERPIIFSAEMAQAIAEGRKTQTRRVMKPQPDNDKMRWDGERWEMYMGYPLGHVVPPCPYGAVGDRLWVRETWCPYPEEGTGRVFYRATDERAHNLWRDNSSRPHLYEWRSPISMPRWASRALLEIVSVRVERVRDISEPDARAEGCSNGLGFWQIWQKLYGDDHVKGWYANPWVWVWVWVIEFRKVEAKK